MLGYGISCVTLWMTMDNALYDDIFNTLFAAWSIVPLAAR